MAIHDYHDVHAHLPAGTVPNPSLPPERRLSWLVDLLPYLEQSELAGKVQRNAAWDAADQPGGLLEPMPIMRCPDWERESSPAPSLTCYVGVAGIGQDAPALPVENRRSGAFGWDRRIKFAHFVDGTSNTMIMLETARSNGAWAEGGYATVRGLEPEETPLLGEDRPFGGTHWEEKSLFRHGKTTGCNVAMADGMVRFFPNHTSPEVLAALATIAGGEKVELP